MRSRPVIVALVCALGVSVVAQEEGPAVVRQVAVQAIPGVVAAGAQWRIVWQGTDNADGMVGTPDGGVIFAQEQPSRVGKVDRNGRYSVYAERTNGGGSLGLDTRGRVYAVQRTCTDPGLTTPCAEPTKVGIVYPNSERQTLADSFDGKPLARPSDLVVATNGGVYFTAGGAF
jgi:gluconolactonase